MLKSLVAVSLVAAQVQAKYLNTTLCDSFASTNLTSSTIRFTSSVAAGSNFTGDSPESSYNAAQTSVPASCRVACEVQTSANSTARFEVWLPLPDAWNSRFLAVGNGGWAGGINYPDIVTGLKKGFATMSTDTGHNSSQNDATWTSDADKMINFGHHALHLSTLATKEIIAAFYSSPASYSYYAGCSTGGRQGWSEVQRYPTDFDGVLVGAPANWMTHLPAWDIRVALEQFPNSKPSYIPSAMWSVVHAEVLRQCDALDGVADGLISDPSRCNFHPETLACSSTNTNSTTCLTPPQIANLHRIYTPWYESNNTLIYEGLSPGGETGYDFLFNGATPQFGIDFYRQAIVNDSSWDYSTIDGETVALADKINPGGINAYDPDLRSFEKAGGKVIEYHGYQDQVIPSLASGRWYDEVVAFYGGLNDSSEVGDFYRLFMVPGLMHCSGGDGAWVTGAASQSPYLPSSNATSHSLLWSLIDWVENSNSTGPEELVGTKYVDDVASEGVQFTRPYCRWPTVPVWDGVGDVNEAGSWGCPGVGVY